MSLWVCDEHGLYGGDVLCPKCGGAGHIVTIALCGASASGMEAPSGGETENTGSTEGESAVAESETPK